MDCIDKRVTPLRDRAQVVEKVKGTWDFKTFFQDLNISVHGHTQTRALMQQGLDAIHVFRFVRRADLGRTSGSDVVLGSSSCAAADSTGDPRDIFMVGKHFLASKTASQVTFFAPSAAYEKLGSELKVPPLSEIPQPEEYRKTARMVKAAPWHMYTAAKYLEDYVRPGKEPSPPELQWVLSGTRVPCLWPVSIGGHDLAFSSKTPNPVRIVQDQQAQGPPPKKRSRPPRPPSQQPQPAALRHRIRGKATLLLTAFECPCVKLPET